MSRRKKTKVENIRHCGDGEHAVVSIVSEGGNGKGWNRREPCEQCPWRADLPTGVFPAEAFRLSAPTSYDAAMSTFACHMSGTEKAATCAGFLLRNADNNLGVRLAAMRGDVKRPITDGGFPLYDSYRDMAVANGVDPDDPVLAECRGNQDDWRPARRAKRGSDGG